MLFVTYWVFVAALVVVVVVGMDFVGDDNGEEAVIGLSFFGGEPELTAGRSRLANMSFGSRRRRLGAVEAIFCDYLP